MRITSDKYNGIGGRIGSMVGMMNKSGMCFRNWVKPTNPKSSPQVGVRNTLAALAVAWRSTLTTVQRAAWNAWAATLSFNDSLGTPYTISGFAAYCAANGARQVGSLSRVDAGPVTAGLAGFTSPTPTFNVSAHTISLAFANTDAWAGEVGGAMIVRVSPLGFSVGRTFYEGPFVYAGKVVGAVTPPSSPATITLAAGFFVAANQYAIAVRAVRADGRYSEERIFRGTAS